MHAPIAAPQRPGHASAMSGPRILLIVGGGIAAYKSCELVRLIRKAGGSVTCVLTEGGQQFVTPMSLAALSGNKVYTSLFDLKAMGYAYAIIGDVGPSDFYEKTVGAMPIPDSAPGIYAGMLDI